jgi:hypothetical protein
MAIFSFIGISNNLDIINVKKCGTAATCSLQAQADWKAPKHVAKKGEWVLNVDSALAAYRFEYDFSS